MMKSQWLADGKSPTRAIHDRVLFCRGKLFNDQDAMFIIACLTKIEMQCSRCKERCETGEKRNETCP